MVFSHRLCIATLLLMTTASCSVGPDYVKPELAVPTQFKGSENWKQARPLDLAPRGQWWQMFCDNTLNQLQSELAASSPGLQAAEARYRQAKALLAQARAGHFPSIALGSSFSRSKTATASAIGRYEANASTAWEVDIWGRVRRLVEASNAEAEASEADLASVTLATQAELVTNYVSLRIADEQQRLLNDTVAAYARSLELTQNLYESGLQTRADFLQAKVQLEAARAQAANTGIQRAAYEHAIATLIGKSPSDFAIEVSYMLPVVPQLPPSLPSDILERRPDIASAERAVAAANARIGVARAAFFPKLDLSGVIGFSSTSTSNWFSAPSRIWSLGPDIALPLFDAGLRGAQTDEAIARYDETVATYRQTVLTAFQEVEDNLAAIRLLQEEEQFRLSATQDARTATEVISNQYKEGITSYLNVANAQTVELNNALSALSTRRQRLLASITLIKAVGGTWKLPPQETPKVPQPGTM